jgi:AbrB family looped-hinge helix DNA binding protein
MYLNQKTVLSSKGQIVLPVEIREEKKFKKGTEFVVFTTPDGVELVEIPDNPVEALRGLTKGLRIPSDAIKKLRQKDEKLFRKKHNI